MIPQPAPRPAIRKGDDARAALLRALQYGDGNARRLEQARDTYESLAREYAGQ